MVLSIEFTKGTLLARLRQVEPRAEISAGAGAPVLDFKAAAPASTANLATQNSGSHSGGQQLRRGHPILNDSSGASRDQSQRVSNHGEHESPAQRGLSVRKTSGDRDKNKNAQRAFRQRKKEKEKASEHCLASTPLATMLYAACCLQC